MGQDEPLFFKPRGTFTAEMLERESEAGLGKDGDVWDRQNTFSLGVCPARPNMYQSRTRDTGSNLETGGCSVGRDCRSRCKCAGENLIVGPQVIEQVDALIL